YEDEAWARAVGGGPIAPTFIEWIEPATTFINNIDQVGFEEVGAPSFIPHPTMSGWVLGTMTIPTPDGVTRAAGDHVPILQSEHQVIGVFAPNYFANPGTSSVSGTTGGLDSFYSNWLVPPYEYWDPEAPSAAPRFFVKDLEGDWRPVGFGKPADELAVFRVPTAVGWYRDLTTAEYAVYPPETRPAGGYPLKVKRMEDDGTTWWDHVGWMVPVT
ncbi:MAG TPA: hypothetical protein VNN79_21445, partial [Actinomycetota bacterium]|nr:hypothetical protein [Actinomycetota bacterium]